MGVIDVREKITLTAKLWNGVIGGKSKDFISYHNTVEEALEEMNRLCDQYPNKIDVPVIIDDVPDV